MFFFWILSDSSFFLLVFFHVKGLAFSYGGTRASLFHRRNGRDKLEGTKRTKKTTRAKKTLFAYRVMSSFTPKNKQDIVFSDIIIGRDVTALIHAQSCRLENTDLFVEKQ